MMFKLTCTLSAISCISWWTRSTFIPTGIGWRWKINALDSRIARLTITLAGVNVTVTEPSCVSPLTCATHVYKLAVSVDIVTFFWLHTLTTVVAGAHINCWTPDGTCAFVVNSNEWQIELQWKNKKLCLCQPLHIFVNLFAGVWPPSWATSSSPSCIHAHEQYHQPW